MDRITLAAALACAALPGLAGAQSVEVRTGANGQLSGTATAGSASSSVSTGTGDDDRQAAAGAREPGRVRCEAGGTGRSLRVVGPGGSSVSSVSVSGGGTAAVAGGGSPGSRIYEDGTGCPQPEAVAVPRGTSVATSQIRPHRTAPRRRHRARR
jgi:hypothetical protein